MFLFNPMLLPMIIICCALAVTVVVLLVLLHKKGGKKNVISEGIANNIEDFREMFEPVYSVAVGKNEKQEETFALWNKKVEACENDENGFKEAFANRFGGYASWGVKVKKSKKGNKVKIKVKKQNKLYRKAAKKLVKYFFKANILRGSEIFTTGSETTAEKYELVGSGSIETGVKYEVLAPYWTLGDDVVDKGVIR